MSSTMGTRAPLICAVMEKSPALPRPISTLRPCGRHVAGHQHDEHAVGDVVELEAIGIGDHQDEPDHDPEQRGGPIACEKRSRNMVSTAPPRNTRSAIL